MRKAIIRWMAVGLLLFVGLSACSTIRGTVPEPAPLKPSDRFRAGAAKVDLTPMPGFPMGGHGAAGSTARGYWTRLFARAIYFEDGTGSSLVLVSCDLWSIPAGLGDHVAELVGTKLQTGHLGRHQIVLAATHTHHGPGNFSSSQMYNAGASHRIGFDRDLFEFLAHRITSAIVKAAEAARPAKVHLLETWVPGLMRNRSFEAFLLNPEKERKGILEENAALPVGTLSEKYPKGAYHAVAPRLTVLKVETTSDPAHTIALAAFVAVHPTAMKNSTAVYNSDLFGVAATVVEQAPHADRQTTSPVVAIFNGAEGDISPDWERQDRSNTLRLGRLLGHCILKLSTGSNSGGKCPPSDVNLRADGPIDYRFTIAGLANRCFADESGFQRCTADHPLPGAAMLGGAEDGRTFLYGVGWKEGVRGPRRYRNQGSKQPALDLRIDPMMVPGLVRPLLKHLTKKQVKLSHVPQEIPLGVYRLGPVVIATLPGEFTMVMGRRIADSIEKAMTPQPARVILVGLANEYLSYFTTPEEYEAQHYEGASTLYGPASGPLVQHYLRLIAESFSRSDSPSVGYPRDFLYGTGTERSFGLRDIGEPPYLSDDGLANVLQDLETGHPIRDFPWYCWDYTRPVLPNPYDEKGRVTPQVAIERMDVGGRWAPLLTRGIKESDEGLNFVTMALKAGDEASTWCSFWIPPTGLDRSRMFRFRVDTLRGPPIWSSPFQVQD